MAAPYGNSFRQTQNLSLTQQLRMTPQLRQSIRLLSLPLPALKEAVLQELMENPFLEEREVVPEAVTGNDVTDAEADVHAAAAREEAGTYDKAIEANADWEDYIGDFASSPRDGVERNGSDAADDDYVQAGVRYAEKPTLEAHLFWQLRLSDLSDEDIATGELIIGNLSTTGYLQASLEELAGPAGRTVAEVEAVLRRIQRFDPVGVAARTPQECLLVQIEDRGLSDNKALVTLVSEHLEDIEEGRLKNVMRHLRTNEDGLRELLAIVRTLDPMPGASYGGGEPAYVTPDVYVRRRDGDFEISLNNDGLPSVAILPEAEKYDASSSATREEKAYFAEKRSSANWLIRSLEQRDSTLLRVMESIVKFQRPFFEQGARALRPLVLREIAEDVGVHESTVSRITSSKYADTPFGVFELRYFFSSAVLQEDGSQVSSETIRIAIRRMVQEEDAKSPLSDEEISRRLKAQTGTDVARRTVAKYRGELGIPSSSHRKNRL